MKKQTRTLMIGVTILACSLGVYLFAPIAIDIFTSLRNYQQRLANHPPYTEITTPLPRETVVDICSNFKLSANDPRCLPDSVVYGPDFFDDIKIFFRKLPKQEATLQTATEKLGKYLIVCEDPDNEGDFRCQYDLRGDGIYAIGIYFTKDGYIYQIQASTEGS
jgi:hypothetical protein